MWSAQFDIIVETLTGSEFEVTVTDHDTIGFIKSQIQKHEGIPVGQQNLIFQDRELSDEMEMCDIPLTKGSRLKFVLGMKGGPVSARRIVNVPECDGNANAGTLYDLTGLMNARPEQLALTTPIRLLVFKNYKKNFHRAIACRQERKKAQKLQQQQLLQNDLYPDGAGCGTDSDNADDNWLRDNQQTMQKMLTIRTQLDSKKARRQQPLFKSCASNEANSTGNSRQPQSNRAAHSPGRRSSRNRPPQSPYDVDAELAAANQQFMEMSALLSCEDELRGVPYESRLKADDSGISPLDEQYYAFNGEYDSMAGPPPFPEDEFFPATWNEVKTSDPQSTTPFAHSPSPENVPNGGDGASERGCAICQPIIDGQPSSSQRLPGECGCTGIPQRYRREFVDNNREETQSGQQSRYVPLWLTQNESRLKLRDNIRRNRSFKTINQTCDELLSSGGLQEFNSQQPSSSQASGGGVGGTSGLSYSRQMFGRPQTISSHSQQGIRSGGGGHGGGYGSSRGGGGGGVGGGGGGSSVAQHCGQSTSVHDLIEQFASNNARSASQAAGFGGGNTSAASRRTNHSAECLSSPAASGGAAGAATATASGAAGGYSTANSSNGSIDTFRDFPSHSSSFFSHHHHQHQTSAPQLPSLYYQRQSQFPRANTATTSTSTSNELFNHLVDGGDYSHLPTAKPRSAYSTSNNSTASGAAASQTYELPKVLIREDSPIDTLLSASHPQLELITAVASDHSRLQEPQPQQQQQQPHQQQLPALPSLLGLPTANAPGSQNTTTPTYASCSSLTSSASTSSLAAVGSGAASAVGSASGCLPLLGEIRPRQDLFGAFVGNSVGAALALADQHYATTGQAAATRRDDREDIYRRTMAWSEMAINKLGCFSSDDLLAADGCEQRSRQVGVIGSRSSGSGRGSSQQTAARGNRLPRLQPQHPEPQSSHADSLHNTDGQWPDQTNAPGGGQLFGQRCSQSAATRASGAHEVAGKHPARHPDLKEFRVMFGSSPTLMGGSRTAGASGSGCLNTGATSTTGGVQRYYQRSNMLDHLQPVAARLDAVPFQYRRGYANLNDACLSSSTSNLNGYANLLAQASHLGVAPDGRVADPQLGAQAAPDTTPATTTTAASVAVGSERRQRQQRCQRQYSHEPTGPTGLDMLGNAAMYVDLERPSLRLPNIDCYRNHSDADPLGPRSCNQYTLPAASVGPFETAAGDFDHRAVKSAFYAHYKRNKMPAPPKFSGNASQTGVASASSSSSAAATAAAANSSADALDPRRAYLFNHDALLGMRAGNRAGDPADEELTHESNESLFHSAGAFDAFEDSLLDLDRLSLFDNHLDRFDEDLDDYDDDEIATNGMGHRSRQHTNAMRPSPTMLRTSPPAALRLRDSGSRGATGAGGAAGGNDDDDTGSLDSCDGGIAELLGGAVSGDEDSAGASAFNMDEFTASLWRKRLAWSSGKRSRDMAARNSAMADGQFPDHQAELRQLHAEQDAAVATLIARYHANVAAAAEDQPSLAKKPAPAFVGDQAATAAAKTNAEAEGLQAPPAPAKRLRCAECNKRLGVIMVMKCRCDRVFCAQHRYAEAHNCTFDYRLHGKLELERDNPVVVAAKVSKF